MSTLVAAVCDFFETFCSGIVSLFSVPAQTLQSSFGHLVWVIPLCLISAWLNIMFFLSICKKKDSSKPLDDIKKEDKK